MDTNVIIGVGALLFALIAGAFIAYNLLMPTSDSGFQGLMGRGSLTQEEMQNPSLVRDKLMKDDTGEVKSRLKEFSKRRSRKKLILTAQEIYFRAGIFSHSDKEYINRVTMFGPIIGGVCGFVLAFVMTDMLLATASGILGTLIGMQAPKSILQRRTEHRGDEVMYHLPLVIEQVSIGVSSSLDIGPCLARVVQMADERDTHNVVTELLKHVQYYMKSGASLEEALNEVGLLSGHNELKHSFMALAQVARHGGEVSRQLQELADAVSLQRETKIEERIKKLELVATGPVALVFVGFMMIFMVGFFLQASKVL